MARDVDTHGVDEDEAADPASVILESHLGSDPTTERRTDDEHIGKVEHLGFLRPAKNAEQTYEVRRVLKAYIDGQWLADFDARLAEYAGLLTGDAVSGGAASGDDE